VKFERRLIAKIAAAIAAIAFAGCARPAARARPAPDGERIVSLAPSVTEILFAIGAGPRVAGVSQFCDYPPAAARLPKVGSYVAPNIEAIAGLRPTLVIGPAALSNVRAARAFAQMGISTIMIDDDSIAGIEAGIQRVGDRVGRGAEARRVVAGIQAKMAAVEERLRGVPPRSVLMVVGHQPMVVVGRATFLGELLALADARNIADATPRPWPRLSLEYVIASGPGVILDGQMGSDPHAPDSFWTRYPSIPAVRDGRVFSYPRDPTLHPGPRIALTLELLARLIHPEAFAARADADREAVK
jgi:iron complex transport system substrate-binding protein